MTEGRLLREAEFHDETFTEATRAAAAGFYSVVSISKGRYFDLIDSYLEHGQRALEFGCGRGGYCLALAERGVGVDAIDISAAGVEMGRQTASERGLSERVNFQIMNAEKLEFPAASFDVVFGSGILHHLELRQGLTEVARVLKSGGRAVFLEPLGHNAAINLYRRLTPRMRSQDEHPLRAGDLGILAEFFGSVEIRYYHLLSLAAAFLRNKPGFARVLNILNRVDQVLFEYLPFLRKQAWIVVISLSGPVKGP